MVSNIAISQSTIHLDPSTLYDSTSLQKTMESRVSSLETMIVDLKTSQEMILMQLQSLATKGHGGSCSDESSEATPSDPNRHDGANPDLWKEMIL